MPDPLPASLLRVRDTEENRASTFWRLYIGFSARLIQIEGDGLWSIAIEEPAGSGWVSSLTGMVVLAPEAPPARAAVGTEPAEIWTAKALPARYNPVTAVNPARVEVLAGPPALPDLREELATPLTFWQRLCWLFAGSRGG